MLFFLETIIHDSNWDNCFHVVCCMLWMYIHKLIRNWHNFIVFLSAVMAFSFVFCHHIWYECMYVRYLVEYITFETLSFQQNYFELKAHKRVPIQMLFYSIFLSMFLWLWSFCRRIPPSFFRLISWAFILYGIIWMEIWSITIRSYLWRGCNTLQSIQAHSDWPNWDLKGYFLEASL